MVDELKNKIKKLREEMGESADEYDFVETEEGIIAEKIVEAPAEERETTGEIIAFMSGKGGVGKTGIAINVANYCVENGKKVLLVDCDLRTKGATEFFKTGRRTRRFFNGQPNNLTLHKIVKKLKVQIGIPETVDMTMPTPIMQIKERYHFIPASLGDGKFDEQDITDDLMTAFEGEYISEWRSKYDLIILDFGAGGGWLNVQFSKLPDKICIVMMPNNVSRQAVRSELKFLFETYNLDNIMCCINMREGDKRIDKAGALFGEFPGFVKSDEYAHYYDSGSMIRMQEGPLYERLSEIVDNVYESSTDLEDDEQEDLPEEDTVTKNGELYCYRLGTTIATSAVCLCLCFAIIWNVGGWGMIPWWAYAVYIVFMTVSALFGLGKIRKLFKKL